MTVVAYPTSGSSTTNFEFEFWLEGEEYPFIDALWNENVKMSADPDRSFIIFLIICVVFGLCVTLCIACCCFKMCCKR